MSSPRRRYSREIKLEASHRVRESGHTYSNPWVYHELRQRGVTTKGWAVRSRCRRRT